jgi:hypothetical protein
MGNMLSSKLDMLKLNIEKKTAVAQKKASGIDKYI